MVTKRRYYAYSVNGDSGTTDNWPECQEIVAGKNGAKYKGFESMEAAEIWLEAGANYSLKNVAVEDGIYFDSGTGAGNGVEINVSDKTGKKLLHQVLPKEKINEKGHHFVPTAPTSSRVRDSVGTSPSRSDNSRLLSEILDEVGTDSEPTNNFGELLACKYALQIAIKENIEKVFGDSKLVIEYWSKGHIKYEVGEETVNLAQEVKKLRYEFEKMGGQIILISGGSNPADLGFHKG